MKNNRNKYVNVAPLTNHAVESLQETPGGAKYIRLFNGVLRRLNFKSTMARKQTMRNMMRDLRRAKLRQELGI